MCTMPLTMARPRLTDTRLPLPSKDREKSPALSRAVGTRELPLRVVFEPYPSAEYQKNVRFLIIGAPKLAPYCPNRFR